MIFLNSYHSKMAQAYTTRKIQHDEGVATIVDYGASYKDDISMCLYITLTVLLRSLGEIVDPEQLKRLSNANPQYGIPAEREAIQAIADIYDLEVKVYVNRKDQLTFIENVRGNSKKLRPVPIFWYEGIHYANLFYFEDPNHERRILDEYASMLYSPSTQIIEDYLLALSLQNEQ